MLRRLVVILEIALVAAVLGVSHGAFAFSVGAFSSVQKGGGPVTDNFSEQNGATFASVDTGSVDSVAGAEARASASVDLGSRSLGVFVRADGPSINPSASATGVADVTIQPSTLLPEGEIVPVPFSMTVTGVANLDDPGFCLSAFAEMLMSSPIDGLTAAEPVLGGCALLGVLPIVTLSGVVQLVVGTPATVQLRLGAALNLPPGTQIGVGGVIDASQTAVANFEFPDGAIVTSDPPEFLPEASAALAQIAAIASLAALSRRIPRVRGVRRAAVRS